MKSSKRYAVFWDKRGRVTLLDVPFVAVEKHRRPLPLRGGRLPRALEVRHEGPQVRETLTWKSLSTLRSSRRRLGSQDGRAPRLGPPAIGWCP